MAPTPTSCRSAGIVVFSGGSAANHLVDVFNSIAQAKQCPLTYCIPISDNGGSSSELIRVFGGPGIGDLRSRLVRLIPKGESLDSERDAIRTFFSHRLPEDPKAARSEWLDIVEARHALWRNISSAKKELIRSFLNFLNLEIVKRARPSSIFNFQSASIGNLFLTGARLFSGSLESAIYLLSSICTIPSGISVVPVVNSNFSLHICAGLADGTHIVGQNSISHPSGPTAVPSLLVTDRDGSIVPEGDELELADRIEDANLPGSLPTLRKPNISFSKVAGDDEDLQSPISRIWYINPYGQEIRLPCNQKVVEVLGSAMSIIYSIGSLYTSLVPSLILRGVGEAVRKSPATQKILILNGSIDRETGPSTSPMDAFGFVQAIARAGLESQDVFGRDPSNSELKGYVTHLLYLESEATPKVDKGKFASVGIETIRLYGPKMEDGRGSKYDEKALTQALEALVGRKEAGTKLSRRNTLER